MGLAIFQLIWSIVLIILGCLIIHEHNNSVCIGIICLILSGALVVIGIGTIVTEVEQNAQYNELINTPAQITQMITDMRTPEEKELINDKIKEYNKELADFHREHLGKECSEKEEEIFNLQPIEELE